MPFNSRNGGSNAFDDVASNTLLMDCGHRSADIAGHVIGYHISLETRIQNAFEDVASTFLQSLLGGPEKLAGREVG
jgi:hypothetical protein